MQKLPGKRALTLVLGMAVATAGAAVAQDTTETGRAAIDTTAPAGGALDTAGVDTSAARDTTDTAGTSGVQNPPGYRGMERDTTMFPPDTGGTQPSAGEVEDRATGTYDNEEGGDTTGGEQNPPGYRGMERPVSDTSAADTSAADTSAADTSASDTSGAVGADTSAAAGATGADTSAAGAAGDTSAQNPPGYRGMERDTTMFPTDTADESSSAGEVEDRATETYDAQAGQDTTGAEQNPEGERRLEHATDRDTAATDTSSETSGSADTSATDHTGHENETEESNY